MCVAVTTLRQSGKTGKMFDAKVEDDEAETFSIDSLAQINFGNDPDSETRSSRCAGGRRLKSVACFTF